MSYTLTAIKHLVKETPVISTDFINIDREQLDAAEMNLDDEETRGEGLNERMRDIIDAREKEGRHQFMQKALRKWQSLPYSCQGIVKQRHLIGHMHCGVINAATAENRLMDDLVASVMQTPSMNKYNHDVAHYFELRGMPKLRKAMARFLSRQLKVDPDNPLNPELLTVTNGAGPGMEMLVQVLTEPGQAWMSPTPHCKQLEYNLTIRGGEGATIPIPLTSRTDGGASKPFELTIRKVKIAHKLAMQRGKKIAGIILVNPQNPLGTIYSKELLKEILEFAKELRLHVIVDEVYALSLHDEDIRFDSVAALTDLPDPLRTHFVWSCSKDLALSGFRCGVVYSWNPSVVKSLSLLSQFSAVPMPVQDKVYALLATQAKFLEEIFIPFNQCRLKKAKDVLVERLERRDIQVHPCKAGLTLWCNVSTHLKKNSHAEELDLCEKMLQVGIWVVPGMVMDSVEPGWIRINFTRPTKEWNEFFKRFPKALEKYHMNNDDEEAGRFSAELSEDGSRDEKAIDGVESNWWLSHGSVMKLLDEDSCTSECSHKQQHGYQKPAKDEQKKMAMASNKSLLGSLVDQSANQEPAIEPWSSLVYTASAITGKTLTGQTQENTNRFPQLVTVPEVEQESTWRRVSPSLPSTEEATPLGMLQGDAATWGMMQRVATPVQSSVVLNPFKAAQDNLKILTGYEKNGQSIGSQSIVRSSVDSPSDSPFSRERRSSDSRRSQRHMARMRGAYMGRSPLSSEATPYDEPTFESAVGGEYFNVGKAMDDYAQKQKDLNFSTNM